MVILSFLERAINMNDASLEVYEPAPKYFVTSGRGEKAFYNSRFRAFLAGKRTLVDSPHEAEILVHINAPQIIGLRHKSILPKNPKKILLRNEPSVVVPKNFLGDYRRVFHKVIDLGRKEGSGTFNIYWPQDWDKFQEEHFYSKCRSDRLAIVSSHKMSLVSGELYSLRRLCAKAMTSVDLFGHGWNASPAKVGRMVLSHLLSAALTRQSISTNSFKYLFARQPNFKGPVVDKIQTLSQYRYSVVIENSLEYMSEKLFDALFAGTIPIYVGPPVAQFGIPQDIVFEAEPTLTSILHCVSLAESADFAKWQEATWKFLNNPSTFENWSSEQIFSRILAYIEHEEG